MADDMVRAFTEDNLLDALASDPTRIDEVKGAGHAKYLFNYLTELGARSIVLERDYTDSDFLDDYTTYYARCFSDYGRRCKRLHFFRRILTEPDLRAVVRRALSDEERANLERDYLGFIVARPLPVAVIGRTVLRTYSADGGRRCFPATKFYRIHFFGILLQVRGLAFQEQDHVLAACATVATWSALHQSAALFDSKILTPSMITRSATQGIHRGRPIPSRGLVVEGICSAIRHAGLDPEVIDLRAKEPIPLASILYGYLHIGLPVILIVDIPGRGKHAVTVVGYSRAEVPHIDSEVPGDATLVPMMGRRIDRFYAHDDQIGPYSRLHVELNPSANAFPIQLRSAWSESDGIPHIHPLAVVIPVYNKIRLTFLDVQVWLTRLKPVLTGLVPDEHNLEWDVHLIFSNDYKQLIQRDVSLPDRQKEALLLAAHPRFWWRAVVALGGTALVEILFDATGIANSFPLTKILWKVESFAAAAQAYIRDPAKEIVLLKLLRSQRYIDFLRVSLEERHGIEPVFDRRG